MPRVNRLPPLTFTCHYYRRPCDRDRTLVRDREEFELLLRILAGVLRRSGGKLYAFHVDSTQLHLVVRAGAVPLIPALGLFCHELTRQLNRRRGESGPLFTQRARVTIFQTEPWLLAIARYVHWIRRRGGLLSSWNSDNTYRFHRRQAPLTTTVVFRLLASRNETLPMRDGTYSEYFDARPTADEIDLIEHGSHADGRILGDRGFVGTVLRAKGPAQALDDAEVDSPDEVIRRAAELVINRFHVLCRRYLSEREARGWIEYTTVERLRSKSRKMPLPLVRSMVADYALMWRLARCSELERYFGLHPKSLAAGLRRRYQSRLLARFSRKSGVAPHRIPNIQRGSQRVDAELLVDLIAVVFDG